MQASRPSKDTHLLRTLIITTPNGIGIKPIRLATKSEWSVKAWKYKLSLMKPTNVSTVIFYFFVT
jgi:hypothetical protein